MTTRRLRRSRINRRAFLRGAGAIAVGLPFLEGLPCRSAWAQDSPPVFSFFIMAQNGVIQEKFWPSATGPLTSATMAGKAVEPLAPYAEHLLMVNGLRSPGGSSSDCGHAQGCVQALTGIAPGSGGNSATSGGPSADMVISEALNPPGVDPLTLYSGSHRGAFIAERLSFSAARTPARPAQLNPYETFKGLMGVASAAPPAGAGRPSPMADPDELDDLLLRKKSVNDVVLEEFRSLAARPELSAEDRRRLHNHMEGIRQFELNMVAAGADINEINDANGSTAAMMDACNLSPSSQTALDAFRNGVNFDRNSHMIEDLVKLHAETVALTFACNANRTATLQWGDGTDGTVYQTKARGNYNSFHKISHQTNSDATSGNDAFAAEAHAEIDRIRMTTFSQVLKSFSDRGLFDNAFIFLTNSLSVGKTHAFNPLPIVLAGSGGGFFKQGEYVDARGRTNATILASLITAAGVPTENFGAGGGQLTLIHAG